MPQPTLVSCGADRPAADRLALGLRAECAAVWFERGTYERAESRYHARLQEHQNGSVAPACASVSRGNRDACRHGDREALHRMVQAVGVNEPVFDQAESRFSVQHPEQLNSVNIPSSLQLLPNSLSSSALYDEGYLSQTPTPPTPASRPINGLPFLPAPLQGVWLQKPLYDRAEASFYQALYRRSELDCKAVAEERSDPATRGGVLQEARPDEAEEQEPGDGGVRRESGAAWCHFLHADSERAWLERARYVQAETRFYQALASKPSRTVVTSRSSSDLKYDSAICVLTHSQQISV